MRTKLLSVLKSLRPHQWLKNLLLFAPLILAHDIGNSGKYAILCCGFLCLCLVASAFYIINDLLDREADRLHPVRKRRPIASGALPAGMGIAAAAVLFFAGFSLALTFMTAKFRLMLLGYAFLTAAYSLSVKRLLLLDVIALSFFYTLRILMGGAAAGVPVTSWFLAFSWFFFLSLAFVKRYVELMTLAAAGSGPSTGRGYRLEDGILIQTAGVASGLLSVLVFLIYIAASDQVKILYPHPAWLWLVAPLLVYWLMRTWFLAQRNRIDSDPVSFAIKDAATWATVCAIAVLVLLGAIA